MIRTERKSHVAIRRQNESDSSDAGQQTTRYDQVCDVVKRLTSHVKRKRDTRKHRSIFSKCCTVSYTI